MRGMVAAWQRRGGISLLLVLLALTSGRAQSAFLRQFGADEGLRQPFVYALAQDARGYLWLGTAEGLVRYDGSRFLTLTKQQGLAEDFVTGLTYDSAQGKLWVRHYEGGLSVQVRGEQFRARPSDTPPVTLRSLPAGTPVPDTASIGRYCHRYGVQLPAGTVITCLLTDREGNTWLGTAGQGLWRHSDRHLQLLAPPAARGTQALARWNAHQLLLGTTSGRVMTASLGAPSSGLLRPGAMTQLPAACRALLHTPAGSWAGTAGAGVWALGKAGFSASQLQKLAAAQDVTALAYSPGSGLWVGTAADGLFLLPADSTRPVQHLSTATGLLHNGITALLLDHRGRLWIGTHGTGLAVYEPASRHFTYHRLSSTGLMVSALAQNAAGQVWVGTEGEGLWRYDQAGHWQQFSQKQGLATNYAYALLPLPGRRLLVVHRQGLSLGDAAGHFRAFSSAENPLVQDCLPAVAGPDAQGAAWVATRAGLLRVDPPAATALPPAPGLDLLSAEVDGEPRPVAALGELRAGRHRVSFGFQGISLTTGGAPLRYQYRLRGLADEWSRPSPAGEAQFPGLDAGRYVLEVRVRRGEAGPWSETVRSSFGIATPFWRTAWFGVLAALGLTGLLVGGVRVREGALRRRQLELETTVRERTSELRQQKAHIEEINEELIVARDAAEASRRAKAQFLANMSHEIRTPMNAVIGLTNLLQNTGPNVEQREYLTAIQSSSQNLLVIINDILDSSKMEAGKLSLERVAFRLPEAVRRLEAMFRFATESKGLFMRVDVDPAVPAAVLGDPVRLNQVLVNLVGNAVKFTRHGGVTVQVRARAVDAEHVALRFAVQDTGIGIPADKLGAIFEDFSQANTSTTREFGGTGLGLSIARNLVQLHGGQLGVRSEEGAGSEFFFELTYPVADVAAAQPEDVHGQLQPFEPGLRVLVAEDNELNQLVARKTLEAWNVQVVIAENGRLAVETVAGATRPFDAVLMDVQMPEMDGYEATRRLRQQFPDAGQLPIIGLTASVLPEDRQLALAAGMNDTLAKPFEPATLYARLAHHTGRTVAAPAADVPAAAAAESRATPSLRPDWHLLEELSGGSAAFISQVVSTFLKEAPALAQLLAEAGASDDRPALARAAHKLKGQVAYFGVAGLHAQLDELERAAKLVDCPYCEALLATVQLQLEELYPQLEARL